MVSSEMAAAYRADTGAGVGRMVGIRAKIFVPPPTGLTTVIVPSITRTITTAIALETNKGQFAIGIALGLILLLIAFCVTAAVSLLRRK